MSEQATCKGCGKKVIFVKDEDGKTQILDPQPPVYGYADLPNGPWCYRLKFAAVSHFSTCPKANDFSKKGKKS